MASRLLLRAIAQAFEVEQDEVESVFREAGDLGLAAEKLTPAESITAAPPPSRGWGRATAGKPRRVPRPRQLRPGPDLVAHLGWESVLVGSFGTGRSSPRLGKKRLGRRRLSRGCARSPRRKARSRRNARSPASPDFCATWTPRANRYLPRIPVGRLRLGIGDPTFMDALSFARVGDKSDRKAIERAYNLTCDLGLTARDYLRGGAEAMARAQVRVGNPGPHGPGRPHVQRSGDRGQDRLGRG